MRPGATRHALLAAVLSAPLCLGAAALAGPATARPGPLPAWHAPLPAAARTYPPPPSDPTPPQVMTGPFWQFRIGTQVDNAAPVQRYPGDTRVFHRKVIVAAIWWEYSAQHDESIRYDLWRLRPSPARLLTNTTQTRYETLHTDQAYRLPGQPGGISAMLHPVYRLVATDGAGHRKTFEMRRHPIFYEQQNGRTVSPGRTVFPTAPQVGPGWYPSYGPDYDGGSVLTSIRRGATLHIPVRVTGDGQGFAIEMSTGPRYGKVNVRVDDKYGTPGWGIDTYDATTRHRVLISHLTLTKGDHVITLTNVSDPDRPMIQFDGVFASDRPDATTGG